MREHPPHLGGPSLFGIDPLEQAADFLLAEHGGLELVDRPLRFTQRPLIGLDRAVDDLDQDPREKALPPLRTRWRRALVLLDQCRQEGLVCTVNSEEEVGTVEDRHLTGHLLNGGALAGSRLIKGPDNNESDCRDPLVFGQMLRVQRVLDRGGVEPVLPGDVGQLFPGGIHHVEPDEGRLVAVDDGPYGHVWQIRLAAAAAPKPLSMLTTVTPAAQELSMPSSAARPPNEAP